MEKFLINGEIDFKDICKLKSGNVQLALTESAVKKITECRDYLDRRMASQDTPIYGINTGFGSLCDTIIQREDLSQLQENLVKSHACGTGPIVPAEIVRLMLALKIQSLAYGRSGVQLQTMQCLIDMYNNQMLPIVYEQGSLGASGDLAPLAHLCLPLIGEGEVMLHGKRLPAKEAFDICHMKPVQLASKEGLALLNGTQFMGAYGSWMMVKCKQLAEWADVIAALSLDAFDGRIEPFHPLIQEARPHPGQQETAERISEILKDSELINRHKQHVQDPYSFRCIPQVHGASRDALTYAEQVFYREINSVTDNPTIFPEEDLIISAGNFHGQPLALALDFLCIAMSELGNISERRTYQLISGKRGLPGYLVSKSGLNSGFMIPQYTAASIVNQNKSLCMPCSVDSIESSQGQEDHVSMGANAATKAYRVVENLERLLAIELLTAAQAIEFRRPVQSSPIIEKVLFEFRKNVAFAEHDVVMYPLIEAARSFISTQEPPMLAINEQEYI